MQNTHPCLEIMRKKVTFSGYLEKISSPEPISISISAEPLVQYYKIAIESNFI